MKEHHKRAKRASAMLQIDQALLITSPEGLTYFTGLGLEGICTIFSSGHMICMTDSRYGEMAEQAISDWANVQIYSTERPMMQMLRSALTEANVNCLLYEDTTLSVRDFNRFQLALDTELEPIGDLVTNLRMVKSEWELSCIIQAQRIAEEAFDAILPELRPGKTEQELAAFLEYQMAIRGSEKPSFDTILISGAKTSLPHGRPDHQKLENGCFVTMDFGAVVSGYHSDMTRTVAIGSATDEMKRVYQTVLEAQLAGIDALEAGAPCRNAHLAAHAVIEQAGYGAHFGHAFGHGVGVEIHEAPSLSPRNQSLLQAGSIVTAEPGIYLPGHFGVRIEDMLFVEESGVKNLTRTPKQLMIL